MRAKRCLANWMLKIVDNDYIIRDERRALLVDVFHRRGTVFSSWTTFSLSGQTWRNIITVVHERPKHLKMNDFTCLTQLWIFALCFACFSLDYHEVVPGVGSSINWVQIESDVLLPDTLHVTQVHTVEPHEPKILEHTISSKIPSSSPSPTLENFA